MTPAEILDLPMEENDAEAATIREYLKRLLSVLWEEEESFGGKRPFGNSGWQWDVYRALVKGGAASGRFHPEGDLIDHDRAQCDALVQIAIRAL